MKSQERRRRSRVVRPLEGLESRALMTIAATAPLPDVNAAAGASVAPVNLDSYFKDSNPQADFAIFNTTLGTIPVLLTPQTTPLTVANFESYISKGAYTNSIVHRSVSGFIWQAGGYQLTGSSTSSITPTATTAPVKNEFSASNVRGTIAMAKLGSDPNSATSEFFFNEADNSSNLDNQNGGFTVFGHVVGAQGLAVMDAIANVPVPSPGPLASPLDSAPLQNYSSSASVQPSNLILINNVTTASELYLGSSDTPSVATATVQGDNLTINPIAAGTAHITVVGYGSDGVSATESFTVNVAASSTGTTPTTTVTMPVTTTPTSTGTTVPTITPTTSTTTSTSTTTATPPVVVAAHSSVLSPVTQGAVPASVVAGKKSKIQQTVSLFDLTGLVHQNERVALQLSTTTTGTPSDITIATTKTKILLNQNEQTQVKVTASQVKSTVPAGTYHLLVSVIDPNGLESTVDTGKTLIVQTPHAKSTAK